MFFFWYGNSFNSIKARVILSSSEIRIISLLDVYKTVYSVIFILFQSSRFFFFHISFHRRKFTYSVNRYYSPSRRQSDRYRVIGGVHRPVEITNSILEPSGHHFWKLGNVIVLICEELFHRRRDLILKIK